MFTISAGNITEVSDLLHHPYLPSYLLPFLLMFSFRNFCYSCTFSISINTFFALATLGSSHTIANSCQQSIDLRFSKDLFSFSTFLIQLNSFSIYIVGFLIYFLLASFINLSLNFNRFSSFNVYHEVISLLFITSFSFPHFLQMPRPINVYAWLSSILYAIINSY